LILPNSYKSAVANLLALGHELAGNRKFELQHMRTLARALGDPQRRLQSVLIAGTNGKGSTAATLAAIVQAAGYGTGLYTSPHLLEMNERIQINREPISNAEFAEIYERVETAAQRLVAAGELPWHPSFFEMLTAIMFEYFASSGIDLAVLEVGMGGRLDATNIADPCVSIITDIDYDHQKFLGNTLTEIAREKAGILRRNGVTVLLPQHPEVNDALGLAILECNARPVSAVTFMPPLTTQAETQHAGEGFRRYSLEYMGREITVESPLRGRHQVRNVALAIAVAQQLDSFGFRIDPRHVECGVRSTEWPGRFQVLPAGPDFPETVLDVAHNPAGAWVLRSALSSFYEGRPLTLIFGVMRDKALREMAEILFPLAERVIATHARNPRAASVEEIAEAAHPTGTETILAESVPAAMEQARQLSGPRGVVVITGSIYIVGEALAALNRIHGCADAPMRQ
jgi:dihydrofolate synthase / folylpolyglutamate synthase